MATLIQSKQIEGVVTSSVIEGSFTVSGSVLATDITASSISSSGPIYGVRYSDIQGTPNFIGGSGILITHHGNSITITNTGGGGISGSAELITSVALLNEYTGSNDILIVGLQSQIDALIAQTGSYETKGRGIISGSSQLYSDLDARYALSGSTSGGGVSSWNDLRDIPVGLVSGSYVHSLPTGLISSSDQILGGSGILSGSKTDITSLNQYTQSNDVRISSLEAFTSALDSTYVSETELSTFSSSIDSRLLSLEGRTDNTGSDTQTLSIVGNQITISGGNTITIPTGSGNTSTDISDTPPTSPIEGDLWWNSIDGGLYIYYGGYWVIAIDYVSAVSQSLLPDGVISGSSQVTITETQGFNEFSSSISASINNFTINDIKQIKGAFISFDTYDELLNYSVSLISNNQVVWVEDATALFKASVTQPDFVTTFEPIVVWQDFNFPGTTNGIGDITAVIAGNGLVGGSFSGVATVNVGAGKGISVSADAISIDTGSLHFKQGVEYWISSGSFIIDLGNI